ncbi:MAG: NtrC-family two-component system sensor histidine kinase KinB [Saprospiraceae bacterium]|jgi:NtrC-family two-component system sensor histidine kinase KinB
MKLKTKIQVALLIIFTGFAILGGVNGFYLDRIAKKSAQMMSENYRSLNYTHEMSLALEDVISAITLRETSYLYKRTKLREAFDKFERYMSLQDANIADKDEEELTIQLEEAFEDFRTKTETAFRKDSEFDISIHMQSVNIRDLLNKVYSRNEEVIQRTTAEANAMINRVNLYVILFGFFIFILAVAAMFYLPEIFARPIKNMTEAMERIARREYDERLPIHSNDEFGKMAQSFNIMAAKMEEYEAYNVEQLLSEKTRIETLISRMKAAIVGVNKDGTVLFANPVAERLLGMKEEEIKDRNLSEIEDDFFQNMTCELRENRVVEDNNYPPLEMEKNGQTFFFSKDILSVKVNDEDGQKDADYGWVIVLKNITKLTQENLAKTNFMARLSHELKTPIAVIDMSANLLRDERIGSLNEEQVELTDTIKQNTNRMLTMVNELIDIAKIESGNIKLDFKKVPPEEIVDYALKSIKTFLDGKKIKVNKIYESDLPKVELDAQKTGDVLINYLTNAIRYTPKNGKIDISIASFVDVVSFSVKDFGNGIDKEELKTVFQKFKRSKGDKTKGTGLGLAISKEFIEAQGGSVWAESEQGIGSVFGFSLPITQ